MINICHNIKTLYASVIVYHGFAENYVYNIQ